MQKKTWIIGSAAASGVLLLGGVTAVGATNAGALPEAENVDDAPLSGSTLSKASDAATEAAGGGKVTDSEESDDKGVAYEVEVKLDNGNEVDVDLDKDFNVVQKDTDKADDSDDDADDKNEKDDDRDEKDDD